MKSLFFAFLLLSGVSTFAQTEADYRRILSRDPLSIPAYVGLIELANTRDMIAKVGQEAIDAIGPRYQIYTAMGESFDRIRDFNNSVKYYRLALSVNPRSFTAYNRLGLSLLQIDFLYQAEVAFKAAISIAPVSSYATRSIYLMHLALTYEGLKDNAKAMENIDLALSLNPNNQQAQTIKTRLATSQVQ